MRLSAARCEKLNHYRADREAFLLFRPDRGDPRRNAADHTLKQGQIGCQLRRSLGMVLASPTLSFR